MKCQPRVVRLQGEFDGVNAHYSNGRGTADVGSDLTKRLAALEEWAEQQEA